MINNRGLLAVCIFVGLFIMLMTRSYGHQAPSGWSYDPFCCNGKDCAEIPTETVKPVNGGYSVSLTPADHPMVTKPHTLLVPYDKVKNSQDGQYHICLYPTE